MRRLALLGVSLISLISAAASAQPSARPQCPTGYELVGPVCQDSSSMTLCCQTNPRRGGLGR